MYLIIILLLVLLITSAMGDELSNLAKLKNYETRRESSSDPNWENGNADYRPIPPGQTLTIADVDGPGEVAHIWCTVAAEEPEYSRLLMLRMYWDGEEHPSVECPLGDFFGIGHGMDATLDSLPVRVSAEGKARNCYWPMPFRKHARITVTNEGKGQVWCFYFYVDWRKLPEVSEDTGYFHAMYHQEYPAIMGRNFPIADIVGKGHYVGTVYSARAMTAGWLGEGDDFFYIDGEKIPSLMGTGTEDYFCDAWDFRRQMGNYYGTPVWEGYGTGKRTSAYRWHIPDPVTFKKSLWLEMEHKGRQPRPDGVVIGGYGEREDDIATVAFWYQSEPHKPWPEMPKGYDRLYRDYFTDIETSTSWQGVKDHTTTVPFRVAESGLYQVRLLMGHGPSSGIFEIDLDGTRLGTADIDLYEAQPIEQEHVFARTELQSGKHTLTIRCTGRNEASTGCLFALNTIRLWRKS